MKDCRERDTSGLDTYPLDMDTLFKITVEKEASDLHLVCGVPPHIRVDGNLMPLELPNISPEALEKLIYSMLNEEQRMFLEREGRINGRVNSVRI